MRYTEEQLNQAAEKYSKQVKGRPSWTTVSKLLHDLLTGRELDGEVSLFLLLLYIGACRNAKLELAQKKATATA